MKAVLLIKNRIKSLSSKKLIRKIIEEGLVGKRQQEVALAIRDLHSATDQEITKHLQYDDPNAVRPRRKELLDYGIIKQKEKRRCNITGREVYAWKINHDPIQLICINRVRCKYCKGKGYLPQQTLM